ncbi:MAG TPA: acyl-CoA dehydrogenase family protein [Candidatus Binataceae bacterium]|nr:acyl-CoA dehydrogenase family protein [Candidatus Binataceae bacterium]
MDFNFTPAQDKFRADLREWLERNSREVFGPPENMVGPYEELIYARDDRDWNRILEYHQRLRAAGYLAMHWPKQWGGGGADPIELAIYNDEVLRLGLPPYGANQLAIDRFGPTLILLGTEAQKKRFLPKMLSCEEIWCQGYSEPNAGSDLAGLNTRAQVDGDYFVINGQKIWTSLAHRADWQVLLVRTDPSAPKHKGLSYLLVDMKTPGITIRPLKELTGESAFNEVFYDNVRVPRENLVGEINQGWQVSLATVGLQRHSAGSRLPVESVVEELVALAKTRDFGGIPAHKHPYVRQRLAGFLTEARCLNLIRYRVLTSQIKGRPPGPESSYAKLFSSEFNIRVSMFADELLGTYGVLENGSMGAVANGRWTFRTVQCRKYTIAGGTSEVQHNVIGERVLGLPKG